jgi:glutamine amidotransferase
LIAVLDYGIGNLRSAEKALQHVGADALLVDDPARAETADGVVLPGVGNFGRCMAALRESGLDRVALSFIESERPFLGICVGMQMLYEGSSESPSVPGLGVLSGTLSLLPDEVKRPQMQWNKLDLAPEAGQMLDGVGAEPWVYFVHSYAAPLGPEVVATCDYGGPVAAAVARGLMWGTQFHPEKSGSTGLRLLANFAKSCTAGCMPERRS